MNILLEHDNTPGKVYGSSGDPYLIYGGATGILNEMVDINEAVDHAVKAVRFRGKLQEADAVNKNQRSYPKAVLEANVKRLQETLDAGSLIGELDHPADSIIHFNNCSHKFTKVWWDNNVLMGEGIILNTPQGKILRALIEAGVRIGMSSRGVGNGKVNEQGVLVIGESYKLITFDAVADPSTFAAYQEKIVGKSEGFTPAPPLISTNVVKNETSGITNNVSKEILLACFSGIVNLKANELKERLS